MPIHQQLQQRIKLLQQMQSDYPETANWFDESLACLTIAEITGNTLPLLTKNDHAWSA